ncbi:MAG: EAL domain-containing protein [Chloroflexota bacterium]
MQARSEVAASANGGPAQMTPPPAPRRRLPMVLLVVLALVLGGALAASTMGGSAGTAPATSAAAADPALAADLARAIAAGRSAVQARAAQGPLARVLAGGSAPAAVVEKARSVLDSLASDLGERGATVLLLDAGGRARLARDVAAGSRPDPLPGTDRALDAVLGSGATAYAASSGSGGRMVLFASAVAGADGTPAGALVAAVPLARLVATVSDRVLPDLSVVVGSDGGVAWAALSGGSGSTGPLSRPLLLTLALLSLLALPLAWWAGRRPKGRHAAVAPVAPVASAAPANVVVAPAPAAVPVPVPVAPGRTAVPAQRPLAASGGAARPPAFATAPAVAAAAPAAVAVPSVSASPAAAATASSAAAIAPAAVLPAEPTAVEPSADPAAPAPGRRRWGRGPKPAAAPAAAPMAAAGAAAGAAALAVAAPATPPEELLDPLSGLGNHRAYQEELDRLFIGFEKTHVPFALLLLDIDALKITNARAGRDAGDEQIRALGRQVKALLRYSDRAFRIGGDELALLLPHTDQAGAVQLGQRLLTRSRAGTDGEPAVAFSGGVAAVPGTASDRDQLIGGAQAALAWAKGHGRATVQAYEPGRHGMETDADRAGRDAMVDQVIRERTLRAVFQPIVDMTTGDVVGFEGLTRPSPGAPFTNPGSLFEAAEAAGRTVELDAACFATVAEGARAIPPDRVVTINLSPRTLEAPDFSVEGVLATLAAHELAPGRVILELTEREAVQDLDKLRENLSALQRAGVRIAADDVGAGNAGLRLLSQFRFDIVKVDLGLVQEGANNDASRAVLRSLRDLAQRWGAFVIAEGIETPTQLKVVRELGLAAGQGYLIGRPGSYVDLPPVDLAGLEEGGLMMQNAPVPVAAPHPA